LLSWRSTSTWKPAFGVAQSRVIWLFRQLTLADPPCRAKVRDDLDWAGVGVEPAFPFGVGGGPVTGGDDDGATVGPGCGVSGADSGDWEVAGVPSSFCTAWALKGSGRCSMTWLATACTALQPTTTAVAVPSNQTNGSQARLMLTRLLPKDVIVGIRDCSVGFLADLLDYNLTVPAADLEFRLVSVAAEGNLDLLPVFLLGLDREAGVGRRGAE